MTGFLIAFSVIIVMITCLFLKYSSKKNQKKMSNDEIPVQNVEFRSDCII